MESSLARPPARCRGALARPIALAALCLSLGCTAPSPAGPQAAPAPQVSGGENTDQPRPLAEHARELWRQRADRAQREAALQAYDAAIGAYPNDIALRLELAHAHRVAAWAELIEANPQAASSHFELGAAAAHAARVRASEPIARARADYYEAANQLGRARLGDFAELALLWSDAVATFERARALCPELDGGGPDRELGSLLAVPPSPLRRDLARARGHFEAALAHAPDALETRLAFARDYAVTAQDREVFEGQLRRVLSPSPGAEAESEAAMAAADSFERQLARTQASELLQHAGELFE